VPLNAAVGGRKRWAETMSDTPLSVMTAQEQAQAYLRDRIITGEIPGGARLKAEELAQRLKISRIPIREALRQLHAEGLVEIRRNYGASVVALNPSDILELFSIRSVLEGLACREAVSRFEKKDLKALDDLLMRMQSKQRDPVTWTERHDRFHHYLCGVAGMPRLSQQITLLWNRTLPYMRLYVTTHHDPEPRGLEHRALLDDILSGDGAHAEVAMRDHIVKNGESIVAFLEALPKHARSSPIKRKPQRRSSISPEV
jgi:DNA-binding GntR family transcriptional regulator